MKTYTKTGKCIWCGRKEPEVTFHNQPHILPHSLGGEEIGTDVCDECNSYFGTTKTAGVPSIDLAFKEIFQAFDIFCGKLDKNTHKKIRSTLYEYRHSKQTVRIKPLFNTKSYLRQFKRGLYEVFLQKYHQENDAHDNRFDNVRHFARYNEGDLRVYYVFNHIVLREQQGIAPHININENAIQDIQKYGYYALYLYGQVFFMEIIPELFDKVGYEHMIEEASSWTVHVRGDEGLYEVKDIRILDFLMTRFNSHYTTLRQ